MKRMIAFTLVFTLLSSGACFAATTTETTKSEPVSVSLDTIEPLWTQHSTELSKIKSDLSISRRGFSDVSDSMDKADKNNNFALLNSLLNSRDQAKLSYDIATAQYDQKIKNSILSAKQAFLVCWQDQLNLSSNEAKLAQKEDQLRRNAQGVQSGYLSQKSYDSLKNSVDDLKNTVNTLRIKLSTDETALKTKLGLNLNSTIIYTYPELNETVFKTLMTIDTANDLSTLQTNSVNVKVLQLTYESLDRYTRSYANGAQVDGALVSLNTAKKNLPLNYTAQYQRMTSQYQDLQNDYRKLSLEKDKLDKMEQQFQKGFVSSLSLNNAKLDFSTLEASVKVKECVLYDTYLSYANMVAGN